MQYCSQCKFTFDSTKDFDMAREPVASRVSFWDFNLFVRGQLTTFHTLVTTYINSFKTLNKLKSCIHLYGCSTAWRVNIYLQFTCATVFITHNLRSLREWNILFISASSEWLRMKHNKQCISCLLFFVSLQPSNKIWKY